MVNFQEPIYVIVEGEDILVSPQEYGALLESGILRGSFKDDPDTPFMSDNDFTVYDEDAQKFWEILTDMEGLTDSV